MPPKKGADKASKKTEAKKKEKIIEDKTFGLKNKKGGKNQKYIAQVQKQVTQGGDPKARRMEEMRLAEKKKKEEARAKEEEEKKMFRPVVVDKQQTLESGVDPKSIFCAFYKQVRQHGFWWFVCACQLHDVLDWVRPENENRLWINCPANKVG